MGDVFGVTSNYKRLLEVQTIGAIEHAIRVTESDRNCKLLLDRLQEEEDFDHVLFFVSRNDTR
jgi:hypothetical protein